MLVIKWAWRYRLLTMETYDDIEDAVWSAESASDYGSESFEAIEVIDGGVSRRLSAEEYEMYRRKWEYSEAETPDRVITHRLEVLYLGQDQDQWAAYEWCSSEQEATNALEALVRSGVPSERTRMIAYQTS